VRAVALSDSIVQEKLGKSFIPLKVTIQQGTKDFPLGEKWAALDYWRGVYRFLGGEKCGGWYGCAVVSPDLQTVYGDTGSGLAWELFDCAAYDAKKFAAMLDRAAERAARERTLRADRNLSTSERDRQLARFREEVRSAVKKEGEGHLPPDGFTIGGMLELHKIAGDKFGP